MFSKNVIITLLALCCATTALPMGTSSKEKRRIKCQKTVFEGTHSVVPVFTNYELPVEYKSVIDTIQEKMENPAHRLVTLLFFEKFKPEDISRRRETTQQDMLEEDGWLRFRYRMIPQAEAYDKNPEALYEELTKKGKYATSLGDDPKNITAYSLRKMISSNLIKAFHCEILQLEVTGKKMVPVVLEFEEEETN